MIRRIVTRKRFEQWWNKYQGKPFDARLGEAAKRIAWAAFKAAGVIVLLLVGTSSASAQTTINSDGVRVSNGAPADVFFMFPLGPESNVTEVQLICSAGTAPGAAFVYEEQPNGQIVTYDNPGTRVDCNETYGGHSPNFIFTGSLKNDITVTTPDHTIIITTSTAWTAANVSCGRSGYCWRATGGSSQIVVQ